LMHTFNDPNPNNLFVILTLIQTTNQYFVRAVYHPKFF